MDHEKGQHKATQENKAETSLSPNTKARKSIDEINNKITMQLEAIKKEQREAAPLVSDKIDLIALESEFVESPNFLKKIAV